MRSTKAKTRSVRPKRHYARAATADEIRRSLPLSDGAVLRIQRQLEQSGALRRVADARAKLARAPANSSKR